MRLTVPLRIGEATEPHTAASAATRLPGLIENLERRVTALEGRLARRQAGTQPSTSSMPRSPESPVSPSPRPPLSPSSPCPSTGPGEAYDDDDPIELVVRLPKIHDLLLDLLRQSAPKETRVRWR
jgi:hypothetical protein